MLDYYKELLDLANFPSFFLKYLDLPILKRLKKVGYFCGMDYASKDVYDFTCYISRFDHSLTVALLTYKLTHDKKATLAALFHDIATPCFSHVIDYMNKDYENQESTEEYTEKILREDPLLKRYLKEDNIEIEDIIEFKKYPIVDNNRPKVCADRLDGVILTGYAWTKNITIDDIKNIVSSIQVYKNEFNEEEIGFDNEEVALLVERVNESIDIYCHSYEDNYMMDLLSNITKRAIDIKIISYEDLYSLNEVELFKLLNSSNDLKLREMLNIFYNVKQNDIPKIDLGNIKKRKLNPLVREKRLKY